MRQFLKCEITWFCAMSGVITLIAGDDGLRDTERLADPGLRAIMPHVVQGNSWGFEKPRIGGYFRGPGPRSAELISTQRSITCGGLMVATWQSGKTRQQVPVD